MRPVPSWSTLSGRRPMLRIPAEAEKGNRGSTAPDDAGLRHAACRACQKPSDGAGCSSCLPPTEADARHLPCEVSRIVSAIGKAADIVVDERTKGEETVRKFASAHDLRRAFGKRWSTKLTPTQLRELMRHARSTQRSRTTWARMRKPLQMRFGQA